MRWLSNLFLGCKALFAKSRLEQELDEELSTYLEHSLADKLKNGMCPIEARQTALRELGGSRNAVKHQVWNSRWESSMDSILQDLRMGFRSLIKSPGFTVIALVSLSLGIGGNTAIFTLMDQMMLRNLPVHEPNQLVAFGTSVSGGIAGGIDLGAQLICAEWSHRSIRICRS